MASQTMSLPSDLANKINSLHHQVESHTSRALSLAIQTGEMLSGAKSQVHHGEWLRWLDENFDGSRRIAQTYVRLFNHRSLLNSKTQNNAHLTIDSALQVIRESSWNDERLPPDVRDRSSRRAAEIRSARYEEFHHLDRLLADEPDTPPSEVFARHGLAVEEAEELLASRDSSLLLQEQERRAKLEELPDLGAGESYAAYGSAREMLTIEAVGSGHQVLAYVNDDEIYDLLETTSPLTHEQLREKLQHVKFVPSSPWVRTPPNSATE
jgi:hypothetical protein